MPTSKPVPLTANVSHHMFRLIHPLIGLSGVVDWRMAYLVTKNPAIPHQAHHVSSNVLEGFASVMWGIGGVLQYEKEVPKFNRTSAHTVVGLVTHHRLDKAFQTSRRCYMASYAGLVGLTMHHAAFGAMAYRRHDSKRTAAHVAAGTSTACYAYLWHSIFLGAKVQRMGISHFTAAATMLTVWLTESDQLLKQFW
ncbi:hypothetical protein H310_08499 [Aphanomyces invadans]|uniref:Uncharacterized protein n=1 Tax=Aphanomyces invadans TaxID=157072 RepID=A0A024U0D7_9STRA|nr:hypothetical protein H310_08499 [Aphanomyces invadans]ETV99067.1 hypothetical protein H310_08499 [Aphanomyces invadans]RHY32233.1 hypothetical protein DYB32_002740 [Aphanomyces invadans]|eukprot:XP_008872495.1 hypothetical protein H310_08499 [Aphanomyces invadans]